MIEPPPLEIKCGVISLVNKNELLTLTSNILSQTASSHYSTNCYKKVIFIENIILNKISHLKLNHL